MFDSLSKIDNNFIPSSVNMENTQVTYLQQPNFFATSSSSEKYNFKFDIHTSDGFILVDEHTQYMTQYEIFDVIFNIVHMQTTDDDKKLITTILNKYQSKILQLNSVDQLIT